MAVLKRRLSAAEEAMEGDKGDKGGKGGKGEKKSEVEAGADGDTKEEEYSDDEEGGVKL